MLIFDQGRQSADRSFTNYIANSNMQATFKWRNIKGEYDWYLSNWPIKWNRLTFERESCFCSFSLIDRELSSFNEGNQYGFVSAKL